MAKKSLRQKRHERALARAAVVEGPLTAWDAFKKVEAIVAAEATVVDMGTWFEDAKRRRALYTVSSDPGKLKWGKGSVCGSVGCLAGWFAQVLGVPAFSYGADRPVPTLLGLNDLEVESLFMLSDLVGGRLSRRRIGPRAHQRAVLAHLRAFMGANEQRLRARTIPPLEERLR